MNFIQEYSSINAASDKLKIGRSTISKSCRYLITFCDGKYAFRYKDENKNKLYKDKNIIYRIIRIDYKGNIKKYKKVIDANKDTGVSQNTIVKVCKGRYLSGGGYLWRYTNYDKTFYENIEKEYNFHLNKPIIDNKGVKYINSLEASLKTKYRLYSICKNLENNYSLKDINFEYI